MSELVEWLTTVLADDESRLSHPTFCGPVWPTTEHLLADIAAKRAIIKMHTGFHECPSEDDNCGWITDDRCSTLVILSTAYADRPGYHLNGWRP